MSTTPSLLVLIQKYLDTRILPVVCYSFKKFFRLHIVPIHEVSFQVDQEPCLSLSHSVKSTASGQIPPLQTRFRTYTPPRSTSNRHRSSPSSSSPSWGVRPQRTHPDWVPFGHTDLRLSLPLNPPGLLSSVGPSPVHPGTPDPTPTT